MALSSSRRALRVVLSGGLKCSSFFTIPGDSNVVTIPFRCDRQKYSPGYALPNRLLNRLWHWFVHGQKIDRRLAKENQERFSIVIDFPFHGRGKSAPVNPLGQIVLRESRDRLEQLLVQCLKPGLETSDIAL